MAQVWSSTGSKVAEMMERRYVRSIFAAGAVAVIWVGGAVIGTSVGPGSGAIFALVAVAVALVIEWMIFRARPAQRGFPIEPRDRCERAPKTGDEISK